MILILIGITSMVSALIFDALPILEIGKFILDLQKESLKIIIGSEFTDDEKQNKLLVISGKILLATIKLIFLFVLIALPLLSLPVIGHWISDSINVFDTLISVEGICISILAFFVYYYSKKSYARFRL